ncbi:hypothetical protein QOT17_012597 [Balamuthia mandrillaris]
MTHAITEEASPATTMDNEESKENQGSKGAAVIRERWEEAAVVEGERRLVSAFRYFDTRAEGFLDEADLEKILYVVSPSTACASGETEEVSGPVSRRYVRLLLNTASELAGHPRKRRVYYTRLCNSLFRPSS